MGTLKISSLEVEIDRKDIKNLHLSVHPPEGRVRVAAPLDVDDDEVRAYVISKLGWIKKHQESLVTQFRQSPRHYVTGESHYVGGQRYLLDVVELNGINEIEFHGKGTLRMKVPNKLDLQKKTDLMERWLRVRLSEKLDEMVPRWAAKMGVEVAEWKIKKMKTKWGSCNHKQKRIWLNLELAKQPDRCVEYIVVHELAHLIEPTHNETFVAVLNEFMPGWSELKQELNAVPLETTQEG